MAVTVCNSAKSVIRCGICVCIQLTVSFFYLICHEKHSSGSNLSGFLCWDGNGCTAQHKRIALASKTFKEYTLCYTL